MKFQTVLFSAYFLSLVLPATSIAAIVVPTEIELPGTQPNEVSAFESPDKCDNCHAAYNDELTALAGEGEPQDEPSTGWRGGSMGNAGRDPIFWATLAVSEQDFDGSGDLCIRCHSTGGWYGGRSTPTDASGLAVTDSDGVDCDTCHSLTDTDDSEHLGVMNSPFVANCSDDQIAPDGTCNSITEGYYGSGMTSIWAGAEKLGPYLETDARHQFMQSTFHRSVEFCGTCHDVSNSAVGDLAPNHGTQHGAPAVDSSYGSECPEDGLPDTGPCLGGPVEEKAAFNNPPYAYGVVERTFSEYMSSAFPTTRVGMESFLTPNPDVENEGFYDQLPDDLKVEGGSIAETYQAAQPAGSFGDYEDGTPRYFSCQSCHMRPTTSAGADKQGVLIRQDLPRHDHTGGNYWLADMIKYQDSNGLLRLGGGLSPIQLEAIDLGQLRAVDHLQQAASLVVEGNKLKVVNLTGHKLISGYPEGRRMWLNIKWFDADTQLLREDGAYGPLTYDDDDNDNTPEVPVTAINPVDSQPVQVESILDLDDDDTRIYEAHYAMTQEWAATLLAVGYSPELVLGYERETGLVDSTLGELAAEDPDEYEETFHFALNNTVVKDNRIPPYGMRYDEAKRRNALPVPHTQYGGGTAGSIYDYWDELDLAELKPDGAVSAEITLYYQGTSWEYIQFLDAANDGENVFLGQEGVNMLETWINAEVPVAIEVAGDRKMVPPVVMATADWVSAQVPDKIGVFRPSTRQFFTDVNGDGIRDGSDGAVGQMGGAGDSPIIGDWNSDGHDEIGTFRPGTRQFFMDFSADGAFNNAEDTKAQVGKAGDLPIIGDWNGDGRDEIGVFRPGTRQFFIDINGDNTIDIDDKIALGGSYPQVGKVGDLPIVGDWNGDGGDEIGVFRPSTRQFFIDVNGDNTINIDDKTVLGGAYPQMGRTGDLPIIGDWNSDGEAEIGVFRPDTRQFFMDTNGDGVRDYLDGAVPKMGREGDLPIIGKW